MINKRAKYAYQFLPKKLLLPFYASAISSTSDVVCHALLFYFQKKKNSFLWPGRVIVPLVVPVLQYPTVIVPLQSPFLIGGKNVTLKTFLSLIGRTFKNAIINLRGEQERKKQKKEKKKRERERERENSL